MISNEALYKKTSEELTALLYEACMDQLEGAIKAIDEKEFVHANEKLQKASDILHRLGAGINYEAGIIADQLDALYSYMVNQLIEANIKKDTAKIQDVLNHLSTLAGSWQAAMKNKQDHQSKNGKQQSRAYEQNVMFE